MVDVFLEIEDIQNGLADLAVQVVRFGIRSIAIPPLGCGLGGLAWAEVKPLIETAFASLPEVKVLLFEPVGTPEAAAMPNRTERPKMTPGRAAVIGLLGRYSEMGYRLALLEVQKLSYFLLVMGEPLKLEFRAHHYGPYADALRHVMSRLEGHYAFLSQVIPYQDSDLEKLYAYLKHLALKLPKRKTGPGYQFDDEVQLEYYRLQKISEGSISLSEGVAMPLDGPKEVGTGMVRDEQVPLSRLIDLINERFGENLSEADQLFFDQITEAASQVDAIRQAAENNSIGTFQLVFGEILESLFIERMDLNEELFARYMNDPEFKELVAVWLGEKVYSNVPKQPPYPPGKVSIGAKRKAVNRPG